MKDLIPEPERTDHCPDCGEKYVQATSDYTYTEGVLAPGKVVTLLNVLVEHCKCGSAPWLPGLPLLCKLVGEAGGKEVKVRLHKKKWEVV